MENGKILIGIGILALVVLLGVFLILNLQKKPINYCEKDSDCKLIYSSCGCEAVNINDPRDYLEDDGLVCFVNSCALYNIQAVCRKNKCIKLSVPEKELTITKEHAIAIANATKEVKEFLKLYPDAKIRAWQDCCAKIRSMGGECKCIMGPDDDWVVAYYKGTLWHPPVSVRIAINSTSGEILAEYPKLEYIKNDGYCEKDEDCSTPKDEHGYACWDCVNFIHLAKGVNQVDSCRTPEPLNCKCINNTCTAVTNKTETQSEEDEENTSNQDGINKSSEIINSGPIAKGTVINLASEDKVAFFFLYNPGCVHCSRAEVHITEIQEMFGKRVIIYKLLVRSPESEPWKQMAKDSGLASYPLTLSVGHKSTKNGTVDESKIGMTQSSGSSKYLQWKENICKQFKDPPSVCDYYL